MKSTGKNALASGSRWLGVVLSLLALGGLAGPLWVSAAKPSALHRAVKAGDIDGVPKLLAAGADVNARDNRGKTALMYAVDKGYVLLVEPLLAAQADPNVRGADGSTALYIAAVHGHSEIITMLMKAGADPTIKGPKGKTPMEVAQMHYGDPKEAQEKGEDAAVIALLQGQTWGQVEDDMAFTRTQSEGTLEAYSDYMASYPFGRHIEQARRIRTILEGVGVTFRDCAQCPEVVAVPQGSYAMGSPASEAERSGNEGPVHEVTIDYLFAVGKYEVTNAEWMACKDAGECNNVYGGRGRGIWPLTNVSWSEAQEYVSWLSRKTGKPYRLLSEAEWEYVARAGTTTPFHTGATISTMQANYDGNSTYGSGQKGRYLGGKVQVGSYAPNAFGLYDVHGNVWELVQDCYNDSYAGAPADGRAWTSGDCEKRVIRGGSWSSFPGGIRSAWRNWVEPGFMDGGIGFRVARTLAP